MAIPRVSPSCQVFAANQVGEKLSDTPCLLIAYKVNIRYDLAVACQLNYQE
ncbi:MAG: hypothetical protein ETSY1_05230 [Candidatus Entotheonella factor]|uniref:Uncharacterized protein n=1 Tax=Entotheonella factor TaxID=1429438 RepID=W4LVQ8_ENTF1|nr:MAG: hypothetical protein ETSY1_05230 [Candidatus Entotheonella factor]